MSGRLGGRCRGLCIIQNDCGNTGTQCCCQAVAKLSYMYMYIANKRGCFEQRNLAYRLFFVYSSSSSC